MRSDHIHTRTLWGLDVTWWRAKKNRGFAIGFYPWERLVALAFDSLRVNVGPADRERQ